MRWNESGDSPLSVRLLAAPPPLGYMLMTDERRLDLVRSVYLAAAAALVLSLTAAFGTVDEPFPKRLIYWLLVMAVGSAWGQLCQRLLARSLHLEKRPGLPYSRTHRDHRSPDVLICLGSDGAILPWRTLSDIQSRASGSSSRDGDDCDCAR
jgi:hypothetical protein